MAVRTALLNGNNINLDSDFSKYVESLTSQWVISWFAMTTTSVGVGKAFVQCTRTNWETIMVYVENTESIAISGNWYIVIKVPQAMIDDWINNPADWIGIATVELVETLPSANYMTLWQIVGGVLADVRYFIPKAQAFETNINNLLTRMTTAEADIEALELAGVPDHIEDAWIVWERYAVTNEMFKQYEPTLAHSTVEFKIWDVAADTQIHIQRVWSWTATNQLKLKLKKFWEPTTGLTVEVRKWVLTTQSSTEYYWYWNQVVCSWTISYSSLTTEFQEFTVTMNWNFWWTQWELLDVVVYQTWSIVNASNYYIIACDSTQWSEWFRLLYVNWTTRNRSTLMPYCVSNWFIKKMFAKVDSANASWNILVAENNNSTVWYPNSTATESYTMPFSWTLTLVFKAAAGWSYGSYWYSYVNIYQNWTQKESVALNSTSQVEYTRTYSVSQWDTIRLDAYCNSSNGRNSQITYRKLTLLSSSIKKAPESIRVHPIEVKNPWNITKMVLYW